jgi:hypothetical protein
LYTQYAEKILGGAVKPLENVGPTVKLLQQTQDHRVIFVNAAGDSGTVSSSEFFQTHREATPEEVVGYDKAARPPAPLSLAGGRDSGKNKNAPVVVENPPVDEPA